VHDEPPLLESERCLFRWHLGASEILALFLRRREERESAGGTDKRKQLPHFRIWVLLHPLKIGENRTDVRCRPRKNSVNVLRELKWGELSPRTLACCVQRRKYLGNLAALMARSHFKTTS
jgi:hypothetical protein